MIDSNNNYNVAAFYSSLLAVFFIPISPAAMNVFMVFVLVFVIASRQVVEFVKFSLGNIVSRVSILLFLVFVVGMMWSVVGLEESLKGLKKYNELWYVALLMPLYVVEKRKYVAVNVFLVSMMFVLMVVPRFI